MDNISKRSFVKICSTISEYVLFLFPLLVDLVSFYSIFDSKFQSKILGFLGGFSWAIIVVIVNVVLLANISFYIERRALEKVHKVNKFVVGYDDLLKTYAEYLTDFEENIQSITELSKLEDEIASSLKELVDKTKNTLNDVTSAKIRVCVKSFFRGYDSNDINDMELITCCRSDKNLRDSRLERDDKIKVCENTDFKLIMNGTFPYFAFNGLNNFEKVTQIPYENSNKKWKKKYNATIVFPISKHIGTKAGSDIYKILGFLCVDTASKKAFSTYLGPLCINYVSSISHILYVFLEKCIICREKIETVQQQESECVAIEN